MRYMLLIYSPESSWTAEEWTACVKTSMGICEEIAAKGQLLDAAPLLPVSMARTARFRDGKPLLTAGPFAETTEQLGGYYVLDVDHLDEAITIASRLPAAAKGTVEIRPIANISGLPVEDLSLDARTRDDDRPAFMYLCYDDEQYWDAAGPEAMATAIQEAVGLTHRLAERGMFLSAAPLHHSNTATSVRVRSGQRIITDGPFAETREVLGGYYVIRAENQEEALAYAAQHPGARMGSVEVRQIVDVTSLNP